MAQPYDRIEFKAPSPLKELIDKARGKVPMSEWIRECINMRLDNLPEVFELLSRLDELREENESLPEILSSICRTGEHVKCNVITATSTCQSCGCKKRYHRLHRSTGLRPCNAFRPRDKEPGEVDIHGLYVDAAERVWRPCKCKDFK